MNNQLKKFYIGLSVFLLSLCFVANGNVLSKSLDRDENLFENSPDIEELSHLTIKIASLNMSGEATGLSEKDQSRINFEHLAEKRFQKLSALIKTDPGEALRIALPEEILSNISDRYRSLFEKREQIEGELEVISECDEAEGRILYYLNTEKGRFSLHFAKQPEEELLTGTKINIKGVRIGEAIAVDENAWHVKSETQESAILANTFGEQKLLVLLVNFQNNQSQPYTIDYINNLIFNTSNSSSVTNYFREVSSGQTWVTGDTHGWFTLNVSNPCSYTQVASSAKTAAQNAGINLSAYKRYMYVFPSSGCSFSGLGVLGGNETWINGTISRQNTAHELGHNLGLYHSKGMTCSPAVLGSSCSYFEYGHIIDSLGGGNGHFHSFQKERLGWLNYGNSAPIVTVTQSGNYSIAPYSSNTNSQPKALKILKSVDSMGKKTWYYIELRRNFGFDAAVSHYASLMNGVMVNLNQESNPRENYMLDMTPETTTHFDPGLTVNRTYTDESAGISITPLSVSDSGAVINVSFGSSTPPAPCTLANPTVSVSPSATQWIGAGSSFTYTVTVTNNNSSSCANTSFNVQPTLPAGWTATVASPVLSLNSGAAAATTVQVFAPVSAADGFYNIVFGASNYTAPSYSASASVSCAVYSSLGVSASPSQPGYTGNQTASVTANIRANGSPAAGASVTFTMTKPDGKTLVVSEVSDANGTAVFYYRFNRKRDPSGTYLVSIDASLNGVSGKGSTSFFLK